MKLTVKLCGLFCLSTASAIEALTKRTTVVGLSKKKPADSLVLATILLECTAARSLVASVSVSSDALGLMLI